MLGDRFGFRPVLIGALLVGGFALLAVPLTVAIPVLALAVLVFTACNGIVGAMVFSLLATEVPPERRSQTLNLVYLPLYAAGIVGSRRRRDDRRRHRSEGPVLGGRRGVPRRTPSSLRCGFGHGHRHDRRWHETTRQVWAPAGSKSTLVLVMT